MAPRLPMPRTTLKRRPSSRNDSPGLSSVPASTEPIITQAAPAASAFTMSPEYLMPPSAMTGTSPAPSTASWIAVICGTPTPVTTRVVQIEPGPTPTLTASAPRSTSAAARGHQLVLGHRLADRPVELALELQIAVGDDADQLAVRVHDRDA